jgi:hypothetical protein
LSAGTLVEAAVANEAASRARLPTRINPAYTAADKATAIADATSYNNFYEFGLDKECFCYSKLDTTLIIEESGGGKKFTGVSHFYKSFSICDFYTVKTFFLEKARSFWNIRVILERSLKCHRIIFFLILFN